MTILMKKSRWSQVIFSCFVVLALCGCPNSLFDGSFAGSDYEDETIVPFAGTGFFHLTINCDDESFARTILPDVPVFTTYKFEFSNKNNLQVIEEVRDAASNISLTLPVGEYDLALFSYTADDLAAGSLAAMGISNNIVITDGGNTSGNVDLKIIDDEGFGSLSYQVSFPAGATAQITITPLGISGSEALAVIAPIANGAVGLRENIGSGYYRITIEAEITASGRKAVRSEVLHIYRGMTSSVTHTFTEASFFTALEGSAEINGAPVPMETLTASVTGSNAALSDLRYIWRIDNVIAGTGINYTVKADDLNKTISVTVITAGFNGSIDQEKIIVPFEGLGTSASNYLIRNEWQLRYLAAQVNDENIALALAHYRLMNDIALTQSWVAIGEFEGLAFSGHFDGNGKTVSNLFNTGTETISNTEGYGFFGVLSWGSVKNLHVVIADDGISHFSSACSIGGITGILMNDSMVLNCAVTGGGISGNRAAGGIAGYIYEGIMEHCYSTVNVTSTSNVFGAGGITGNNNDDSVINCIALNPVIVSANVNAGRVAGIMTGTFNNNKARSDMIVNNLPAAGGNAANKDGADVTVGAGTTLASVFAGWDENIWDIPSGNLVVGGALPTLKCFTQGAQVPVLPAGGVSAFGVTVNDGTTVTGYANITAAFAAITTAGNYTVMVFADQVLTTAIRIQTENVNITLIGGGAERRISQGANNSNINIQAAGSSLTLGDNITISHITGTATMGETYLVGASSTSTFIMLEGSKITGSQLTAVRVTGGTSVGFANFIMYGGEITGNNSIGVALEGGTLSMRGGTIKDNNVLNGTDIQMSTVSGVHGKLVLTGDAQIGTLRLQAGLSWQASADIFTQLTIGAGWTGNVDELNLASGASLDQVIGAWEGRQVLIGEAPYVITADDFSKITLGNFEATNNPQAIELTHFINNSGVLVLKDTVPHTVTVTNTGTGVTTQHINLGTAIVQIRAAGNYDITLLDNQIISSNTSFNVSGVNARIISSGGQRNINNEIATNSDMFTISAASGASLTIGENITIIGNNITGTGAVVSISTSSTFTMQSGSRITGHRTDNTTGAAVILFGGNFIMNGGSIDNNINTAAASNTAAAGGVALRSGTITMNGGSIKDNWQGSAVGTGERSDVYHDSADANFTLTGSAEIGVLKLNAASETANAAINTETNWTGEIDLLNLRGSDSGINAVVRLWANRLVFTGVSSAQVARVGLGEFISSNNTRQPITPLCFIGDTAPNLGRLLINTSLAAVTVSVNSDITGYMNILDAFNAIGTTAGNFTITLNINQSINSARTINTANQNITIVGADNERTLTFSGAAATTLFLINNPDAGLTLGNVTIQGRTTTGSGVIVSLQNGTFTMQPGSRITGHRASSTTGAAVILGGGNFIMNGGSIDNNLNTSAATTITAAGGLSFTVNAATFTMNGGSIKDNWQGSAVGTGERFDVYHAVTTANRFNLSGSAEIGALRLNATSATVGAAIVAAAGWTGEINILNLRGDNADIETAAGFWNNRAVFSSVTAAQVARVGLGDFINNNNSARRLISATHTIGTVSPDRGRLIQNPQAGINITFAPETLLPTVQNELGAVIYRQSNGADRPATVTFTINQAGGNTYTNPKWFYGTNQIGNNFSVTLNAGDYATGEKYIILEITINGAPYSRLIKFVVVNYKVGDTGPAGGIIFYHNPAGFTVQGYGNVGDTGYFATYTAYYLEAAPANASVSTMGWSNSYVLIPNLSQTTSDTTDWVIGRGRLNTAIITAALPADTTTNNAAKAAAAYSYGGKNDWFLPSREELNQIYLQRSLVGITTGVFWSSSQYDHNNAWYQLFASGNQGPNFKGDLGSNVRAVRAF